MLVSLNEIVQNVLWPEARRLGKGTDYVNHHPIVALMLNKLVDLNGLEVWSGEGNAHDQVKAIALSESHYDTATDGTCAWCGADQPHVCPERV